MDDLGQCGQRPLLQTTQNLQPQRYRQSGFLQGGVKRANHHRLEGERPLLLAIQKSQSATGGKQAFFASNLKTRDEPFGGNLLVHIDKIEQLQFVAVGNRRQTGWLLCASDRIIEAPHPVGGNQTFDTHRAVAQDVPATVEEIAPFALVGGVSLGQQVFLKPGQQCAGGFP